MNRDSVTIQFEKNVDHIHFEVHISMSNDLWRQIVFDTRNSLVRWAMFNLKIKIIDHMRFNNQ